ESLQGSLAVERVDFGVSHLVLRGVTLRDPDGAEVAQLDRLEVRVSLGALVHKTIDVRELELVAPRLSLVQDASGASNLSRALAPRKPPKAAQKQQSKSNLSFVLGRLTVSKGRVEL